MPSTDRALLSTENPHGAPFSQIWLMVTGAFLFSIVLLILVHELGHYLAFRLQGYENVSIRINPFMGTTSTPGEIQERDVQWILLGGIVFNLSAASLAAIARRFTAGIARGLLTSYAATAFFMEGSVVAAGMFFEEKVTDFSWLLHFGWPRSAAAGTAIVILLIAGALIVDLWKTFGIQAHHRRFRLVALNAPIFLYGILGVTAMQVLLPIDAGFFRRFALANFAVQFVFLGALIALAPGFLSWFEQRREETPLKLSKRQAADYVILGSCAWVLSFLVLN